MKTSSTLRPNRLADTPPAGFGSRRHYADFPLPLIASFALRRSILLHAHHRRVAACVSSGPAVVFSDECPRN